MLLRRSSFPILLVSLVFGLLGYTHTVHAKKIGEGKIITPGPETPTLTLSKNVFPASKTCRHPSRATACRQPTLTSFELTYAVPKSVTIAEGGRVLIIQGYKYKGEYMTDYRYVHPSAWSEPNIADPNGYNYVYTRVRGNGGRHDSYSPATFASSYFRSIEMRFQYGVAPGATIHVFFGNRGRGYVVPTVAYDVDLVVLQDLDNDGVFELAVEEMPTLRVIGTDLDRFKIVAPSEPSGDFMISVQALQGEDTGATNMYLVQNYTGTIRFSSSDENATLPADYTFSEEDKGSKEFSVTLSTPGIHTISVEEVGADKRGTSNPIRLRGSGSTGGPIASGRHGDDDDDWRDDDDDDSGAGDETIPDFRLYWGVLQQHTNIGGHGQQTPEYALNYAQHIARLDFFALTEHCGPPDVDHGFTWGLVNDAQVPGEFVTFPGYEWASKKYGHRHIIFRDMQYARAVSDRDGTPGLEVVPDLDGLLAIMDETEALTIPHHTAWKYREALRQPDDNFVIGDINSVSQRLFEMYSHHGSSEAYEAAPYEIHFGEEKEHQWEDRSKLAYFQDAIAAGYKFGVTSGTDDHLGKPGGNVSWGGNYSRTGLTAVLAKDLTRESIWEALYERRTYGTTGARIIMDYSITSARFRNKDDDDDDCGKKGHRRGRHMMGAEATIHGYPKLNVNVIGTDEIDRIEIIRNGLEPVFTHRPEAHAATFSYTDRSIKKKKEYSYYVRVVQKDEHMAWSSPIWVTRDRRHHVAMNPGDADGRESTPDVKDALEQNVPNPFNPSTTIQYSISTSGHVSLRVYDVAGRVVRTLVDESQTPREGGYRSTWDGRSDAGHMVPSGIYFYRLVAPGHQETRKMLLLK